jgi:hypothetical protein
VTTEGAEWGLTKKGNVMKKNSKQAARSTKKKRTQQRGMSRRATRAARFAQRPIRQFRNVIVTPGVKITICSVLTGAEVQISVKCLNGPEKRTLSHACDFIERKLVGTSYAEPMQIVMKATGFFSTVSRHMGAYSGTLNENPIVILNEATFTGDKDEFAVTILHELLHLVTEPGDPDPTSLDEAIHDLRCYLLLYGGVPADHWAFTKHPHLKDELFKGARDTSAELGNITE